MATTAQAAFPAVDFDVAMEVASHEALIRQTYKDSVGVLTWCVGMTNATGHTVERYIGKPASLQHCMNSSDCVCTGLVEVQEVVSIGGAGIRIGVAQHVDRGIVDQSRLLWPFGPP